MSDKNELNHICFGRSVVLLICLGVSILGCGPKPNLVGEEYFASPELHSQGRIAVLPSTVPIEFWWQGFYEGVNEQIVSLLSDSLVNSRVSYDENLASFFGVVPGGSDLNPEKLDDNTFTSVNDQFGVDMLVVWDLDRRKSSDQRYNEHSYRLTVRGVDCSTGELFAYGSGQTKFTGTGFEAAARDLTERVVNEILSRARPSSDAAADR